MPVYAAPYTYQGTSARAGAALINQILGLPEGQGQNLKGRLRASRRKTSGRRHWLRASRIKLKSNVRAARRKCNDADLMAPGKRGRKGGRGRGRREPSPTE